MPGVENRTRDVRDNERYEAFEDLHVTTSEIQCELFRFGVRFEFAGSSDEEFDRRTAERRAKLESIREANEEEGFAKTTSDVEAERMSLFDSAGAAVPKYGCSSSPS